MPQNTNRYEANTERGLLIHSTYFGTTTKRVRQKIVTLTDASQKRLTTLMDSKIPEVRNAAHELHRAQHGARLANTTYEIIVTDITALNRAMSSAKNNRIKSANITTRFERVVDNNGKIQYSPLLDKDNPYIADNPFPFPNTWLAQRLYGAWTSIRAFFGNVDAEGTLTKMNEYDEKVSYDLTERAHYLNYELRFAVTLEQSNRANCAKAENNLTEKVNEIDRKEKQLLTTDEKSLLEALNDDPEISVTAPDEENENKIIPTNQQNQDANIPTPTSVPTSSNQQTQQSVHPKKYNPPSNATIEFHAFRAFVDEMTKQVLNDPKLNLSYVLVEFNKSFPNMSQNTKDECMPALQNIFLNSNNLNQQPTGNPAIFSAAANFTGKQTLTGKPAKVQPNPPSSGIPNVPNQQAGDIIEEVQQNTSSGSNQNNQGNNTAADANASKTSTFTNR